MAVTRASRALHKTFELGVVLKGIDGLLEIIGAALVYLVTPDKVSRFVSALTRHEWAQDHRDFVMRYVIDSAQHLSTNDKVFASLYLLSHGVVKVWLVWALLRSKPWAYPIAIAVFTAFGVYQVYRWTYTHSMSMVVLTVLDVFVILLTWQEYRTVRGAAAVQPRV